MRKVQRERERREERNHDSKRRRVESQARESNEKQGKKILEGGERWRGRYGEWGLRQLNIACHKMINTLIQSYEDTSSPVMR